MPFQLKSDVGTSVHCRRSRSQHQITGVVFLQTKRENSLCCLVVCGRAPGLAWEAEAVTASMAKQFCSGTCGRGSLSVGSKIPVPTQVVPEELSLPLEMELLTRQWDPAAFYFTAVGCVVVEGTGELHCPF